MILLDTDHLTVLQEPISARRERLLARMALSTESFGTTVVCVVEQVRGWMASIAKERQAARQVLSYTRFTRLIKFLAAWHLTPFDASAAARFDTMGRIKIGAGYRKIAAIAITQNALLLTANRQDFEHVPELRFENWMDGPTAAG
jgi:tRNA(fMet)-specific endonuclease VapC